MAKVPEHCMILKGTVRANRNEVSEQKFFLYNCLSILEGQMMKNILNMHIEKLQ